DQAVYDALVRMVQDFSCRYPLLGGHGNFGSVDDDPPAAMRYTETRLAAIGHEAMLSEIGEATVDFISNFDNSQQEPSVLPAQLPFLLLNGCAGIAVGMATNVPPHNLGELIDGLIALIDNPELPFEKLLELIPGPDFPTGGEIVGTEGIREAYSTGKGSITVRGVVKIEEIQGSRGRHRRQAIVVTELPFQVNKAGWIEKVAELVNQGRVEGIADLRDESDRDGMRVVIELKREVNPQDVLEQLYKQTALSSNFGTIMLALVDGQPRQLSLQQVLQEFLTFREQTLTRQYTHELEQTQRRRHLVEALLTALSQLDAVIDILRNAPDGSTAKLTLQSRFNFSDRQCDAILSMPLRRLTGLERQQLQTEFDELSAKIEELQRLLSDRRELLKALKKDLRALKRKYGDARRTRINKSRGLQDSGTPGLRDSRTPGAKNATPQLPITNDPLPEEVVLEFTHKGYVRRLSKNGKSTALKAGDDFAVKTQVSNTGAELVVITDSGKAYPVKVKDIPQTSGQSRGTPLPLLLPNGAQAANETIATYFLLPKKLDNADLVILTCQGRIKRLPATEIASLSARGMTLIKLKDNDKVSYASLTNQRQEVILATSGGRVLRFQINEQQLPIMGRTAQGIQAVRLRSQEKLVGALTLAPNENILLVSSLGYAKRMPVSALRLVNIGEIGSQMMQFIGRIDNLVGMVAAKESTEVTLVTERRVVRVGVKSVQFYGKDGMGDRIVQLNPDEKIINVVIGNG
ncbi:MAG TPA: DNA topoisomerase IV, partial [Cyanobacteria bacterium UBA11369]|nr:DNA topoisomerase IV [Cyanobacteria bacterium UBA11369]